MLWLWRENIWMGTYPACARRVKLKSAMPISIRYEIAAITPNSLAAKRKERAVRQ
jgi:hypothetical protein